MRIEDWKRWQWACIGIGLGLIVSFWRGYTGAEEATADRTTLTNGEFEKLIVRKGNPDLPEIKRIRPYRMSDGGYWLTAERLILRGKGGKPQYVAVRIPAKTPYIPQNDPPVNIGAHFTVIDYLKSVQAKNPDLDFSSRWWDHDPLRTPTFAIAGLVLFGGLCPTLIDLLVKAGYGKRTDKTEPDYDLSRFGKGAPAASAPARPEPTEEEQAKLQSLEAEMEQKLAAADSSAVASAADTSQPVKELSAGPLETAPDGKPKEDKDYAGEFYPTETHGKKKK